MSGAAARGARKGRSFSDGPYPSREGGLRPETHGRRRSVLAVLFACSSPPITVPGAARAASNPDDVSPTEEHLVGQVVTGFPAAFDLWDTAVGDSGTFIAVGTVSTKDDSVPLVVWRSGDGRSWRQVFRPRDLGYDSSYVPEGRGAVAACHPTHRMETLATLKTVTI